MLKKIIFAVLICLSATACKDNASDDDPASSHPLLKKETPGIYSNNDNIFIYDADIHQYAYNTRRRTFRLQNTSQDRYLACRLSAEPSVNSYVTIDVKTRGISSFPSQELEVRVLKRSQGKVWLWNDEKKTGFVIRIE